MKQPIPVLPHVHCELGEGPVWDAKRRCLWWVDILAGALHRYGPETEAHHVIQVGGLLGAVALRTDGGLVAATEAGFQFLDAETGALSPIQDPEAHLRTNRFNDGKADPQGRFWAGTMSLHDLRGQGALYMLDLSGIVHRQLEGVSISNGLAWSNDGRTLFYVDSPTFEVRSFAYEPATGALSDSQVALTIPPHFGDPDGMTIDTEGCLWIAHWDGWQVTRWDPRAGTLLLRISLPAARVTSCTFGGETFSDLYVTTARTGLSADQTAAQPLAGSVFVLKDCGYKGVEPHRYAG